MKIAKNIILGLLISFVIVSCINSISVNNNEFLETDKKHKKKTNSEKAPQLEHAKLIKEKQQEDTYSYNYDEQEKVQKANEDRFKTERSGISPKYVKNLPGKTSRYVDDDSNVKVSPEFLKDEGQKKDYYDGLDNLSARTNNNNCKEYSGDEESCLSQGHCGVCDDNNSCVPGGKSGAFVACRAFRYFSNPKQQ